MDYFRFKQALNLINQKAADRARLASQSAAREIDESTPEATAESWHEHAIGKLQEGDSTAAFAAWEQALRCEIDDLTVLHRIGQGLRESGHDAASVAERQWEQSDLPSLKGLQPSRWQQICLHVLREEWQAAMPAVGALAEQLRGSGRAARSLAFLHERLGERGQAQCVLAAHQLARGDPQAAARAFLAAPEADARSPEFLPKMLLALREAGEEGRAIEIAEATAALGNCPSEGRYQWASALLDTHRPEEALAVLRQGGEELDNWSLKLQADLILPAVPASQVGLDQAHQRVDQAIRALSHMPIPCDEQQLADLEDALEPNFMVGYSGEPRVGEARAFGQFVRKVLGARFPEHDAPVKSRPRSSAKRLRIGYATSLANFHTVARYFAGWLQHADRTAFELHLFPLSTEQGWMTGYLSSLVDVCHSQAFDTATAAKQIREADLDVLTYLETGMCPLSMKLAALRLVPVQCSSWGHPVTTGLDTIDYFLSADAMEADHAQDHYTERLVTLADVGVCMPELPMPATRWSRAEFGIPADRPAYLSAQSSYKYVPRYDDLFARIAETFGDALFVFVEGHYPAWTRTLRKRLSASFAARGLDLDDHVMFIPRQGFDEFLCLNRACDVSLDPIGWSGGMSSFDALNCGLPIVTLPGDLMRSRQTYGMLRQIGVEELIATDMDDYVRIAARLGQDPAWREDIAHRIREKRHLLFENTRPVKSLEAFYRWAAGTAKSGDEELFKLWPRPTPPSR